MLPSFLFALSLLPGTDPPPLELRAAWLHGDPAALCVSGDATRVWSAEGGMLAQLRWDGRVLSLDERRPYLTVDASTCALAWTPERLWIAGGSHGLLALDLDFAADRARAVDDPGDAVCLDVAVGPRHVVALFAALDASELAVYVRGTRDTGERVGAVALGPGTAYALELDGDVAYVAMGTGGLVRVDLADPTAPAVAPGPRGSAFVAPEGPAVPVLVRDVAVAGDVLWAAADAAGLARVDLARPWERDTPVALRPLAVGGKTGFATRVDARGDRVAVGLDMGPAAAADGAPYASFGWMGPRLDVGGVPHDTYEKTAFQMLLVFQRDPVSGDWRRETEARLSGGWRTLVLGERWIFEQHVGEGLVVRPVGARRPRAVARRAPPGFSATDGVFSRARPGRLYFGTDPAGSVPAQALELDARGRLGPARLDVGATPPPLGLAFDALWVGDDGAEWLVGATRAEWRVFRLGARRARWWDLPQPPAADGGEPHTYLHSALDDDLLLLTRYGTRYGLVGLEREAVESEAAGAAPGSAITPLEAFQVTTHVPKEAGPYPNWRAAPLRTADGRRLCVVAAGFNSDPDSRSRDHGRLVVVDLDRARAGGRGAVVGAGHGRLAPGQFVSVATARVAGRDLAFAADLAGGLDVFDVGVDVPELVGGWQSPPNPFDGRPDNVVDVAVEADPETGTARAYLACLRGGVVVLDATRPDAYELPLLQRVDTPGLAWGLTLGEVGGERLLAVGDHQAGLRVYARP